MAVAARASNSSGKGSDKSSGMRDGRRVVWLLLAVAISLSLSLFSFGNYVLYPFKLFTTWVHECGHATMALLVGGSVRSITISPDTSGLTMSLLPSSSFARGMVSTAGYMGASVVGCVLLAVTRLRRFSHVVLFALGALMLLSIPVWIRNAFGLAVVVVLGVGILAAGRYARGEVARFLLSFLATQVALNALLDIRVLFQLSHGEHSDAQTMATLFVLPQWFWAGAWMMLSVTMVSLTLWFTRERTVGAPP